MATNEVPRGPVSGYVVDNVKRLRAERRWSLADLSEAMKNVGRPMLTSGLHRLEAGKRRIDADDLVALAAALRVSPVSLLLPPTAEGEIAITDSLRAEARAAWDWMRARRPLTVPADEDQDYMVATFLRDSLPKGVRTYPPTTSGRELLRQDHPDLLPRERTVAEIKEGLNGEHQEAP